MNMFSSIDNALLTSARKKDYSFFRFGLFIPTTARDLSKPRWNSVGRLDRTLLGPAKLYGLLRSFLQCVSRNRLARRMIANGWHVAATERRSRYLIFRFGIRGCNRCTSGGEIICNIDLGNLSDGTSRGNGHDHLWWGNRSVGIDWLSHEKRAGPER